MNCPHCQKALRPDSLFCTGCGQSLNNTNTQVPVSSVQAKQHQASDPLIGHLLDGKYQLLSRLGQGGMGTVYRARRVHIGDEVAVKVLHTRYVAEQEAIERFRREARAAAQLRHPNVVVIYDYGEAPDAGVLGYIVMELVEGRPLGDILEQEGRLKPERAIALMRQICAGVGAAHKRNIIHRDLKPDNIVVLPAEGPDDETLKVVDFGLAKLRDQLGFDAKSLTQAGMIIGTPNYMSPEQCRGDDLDSRADVYSLGAILFEMLAGEKPFNAPSAAAVIVMHIMDPPPSLPNENELPPALTAICRRALSKDPTERQADATELAREISEALNAPAPRIILPSAKQTSAQPQSADTKITGTQTPLPTLTQVGAPQYQPAWSTPEVERKSKGPLIGIVLAIVAVLVIAGVVGAFLLSKSNVAQTENANSANSKAATNQDTGPGGGSNSSSPIGGNMSAGQANSLSGESSRLGKAILGRWKTKTGRLEIEFKQAPTGIEGIILRVPDSWPKSRVNIGDAIFVKGKLDGNKIEGLYINVPQNADCPGLETRYSKCVISFEDNNTLKVTNSAWKYSFPACSWSLVTYDDTWNWIRLQ